MCVYVCAQCTHFQFVLLFCAFFIHFWLYCIVLFFLLLLLRLCVCFQYIFVHVFMHTVHNDTYTIYACSLMCPDTHVLCVFSRVVLLSYSYDHVCHVNACKGFYPVLIRINAIPHFFRDAVINMLSSLYMCSSIYKKCMAWPAIGRS